MAGYRQSLPDGGPPASYAGQTVTEEAALEPMLEHRRNAVAEHHIADRVVRNRGTGFF